jgi:hypothetical protein
LLRILPGSICRTCRTARPLRAIDHFPAQGQVDHQEGISEMLNQFNRARAAGHKVERARCWWSAIMGVVLALAGCSSLGPSRPPEVKPVEREAVASEQGWWYARFVMNWPDDTDPSWYMDLLLAHRVVSPVLAHYRSDILFWRFHRRAIRDQAGHQFSFIFYASPATAAQIYDALEADECLRELRSSGQIQQVTYDDPSKITRPNIEDASDTSWALPIKKSWPHFILGVSQMWLDLIADYAGQVSNGKTPTKRNEVQTLYKKVDDRIKEAWQEQGRHAFLHHLNAIFEYEPLAVYEKRMMRF